MIGFIGFGEAAFHIARGLRASGAPASFAFDIHWVTPGKCERIGDRAGEAGVGLVESPAKLAERCDILLSLVTADRAVEAASQNRPCLGPRHLYVELNSVSPETKRVIGESIGGAGARFVEGAIMAPVPGPGHRVPILVNGPYAGEFVAAMRPYEMRLETLDAEIGSAAAVKMCRSIVIKGMEALMVECLLASGRYGTSERVFQSLEGSYPGMKWRELARYMAGRVFEHGPRRAREMEEVEATLRSAGIEPIMSEAIARRQDWRAHVGDAGTLDEMLGLLGGAPQTVKKSK